MSGTQAEGAGLEPLRSAVYGQLESLVERARRRLALVQRTSSLVLGPRRDRLAEESSFLERLRGRIEAQLRSSAQGTGPSIVHAFELDATLAEFAGGRALYPHAEAALGWLEERAAELEAASDSALALFPSREPLTPLVLADSALAFSFSAGRDLWFAAPDAGRAASELWEQLVQASAAPAELAGFLRRARRCLIGDPEAVPVEVVVPESGAHIGMSTKAEVHRPPGLPHRAFSAFVVGETGRLLLQRRSARKYHFAGLWSNACCSHPVSAAEILRAACRRVRAELGLELEFRELGSFWYRAEDPRSGLVEVEFDHVLLNRVPLPEHAVIAADLQEVSETRWIELAELRRELEREPAAFTPWLGRALAVAEPFLYGVGR